MAVKIKTCSLDDLDELQETAKETFYETYAAQMPSELIHIYMVEKFHFHQLKKEIMNPSSTILLAYLNDQSAEYKNECWQCPNRKMGEDFLEVERIYIKKIYQKNGLGKYLLNKAVQIAKEKQKQKIWLGVWEKNAHAITFYEKMGFKKVGIHSFTMGEEVLTDFTMVKSLYDK